MLMKRIILLSMVLTLVPVHAALGGELDAAKIRQMTVAQTDNALQTYRDILGLPNDTHYPDDIQRLVQWLRTEFGQRSFKLDTLESGGSPFVFAERSVAGANKTALIYLQADGQPVDPTLWQQKSPYQATLKKLNKNTGWQEIPWDSLKEEIEPDWRIFARSAADSKGPIAQFLTAIDAIDENGLEPAYNLKVIMDTEEENGSPNLPTVVMKHKDRLAADFLLIFDGPPHASNEPTLVFGARGIAKITLKTHGPRKPQHSGHYGNYVPNPALALAQLLASMKSPDGRVLIPGFYDGIEINAETRELLDRVPDDTRALHQHLGIAETDKVADSLQLAIQYPSLNIRGLSSLKVGIQSRTLIPASAIAELDVRLVKESDPARLIGLIKDHIIEQGYHVIGHEPTMAERLALPKLLTFKSKISYKAFRTDFDSEPGLLARGALKRLYGAEPILLRTSGGSIPISPFVEALDIPAVMVPTVNIDNNQHAPDENLRLGNFIEGISILIAVLMQETG